MFQGRLRDSSGALLVQLRPGAGVSTARLRRAGWALETDGYSFVADAVDGVPASARMQDGIAFSDDGAIFVTDTAIGAGVRFKNGMAIRSDGALHVNCAAVSSPRYIDGVAVDASGRVFMSSPLWRNPNIRWWDASLASSITSSLGAVSEWRDRNVNATALSQGTGASQPAVANGVITFDGTDDYLDATFTLNQPYTGLLVGNQVTWAANEHIVNDPTGQNVALFQRTATPGVALFGGATLGNNTDWAVGTNAVLTWSFNGASSFIKVNRGTALSGNAGAANPGGVRLGANFDASVFSNFQLKALAICAATLTAAQLDQLIVAAGAQYGIAV